jgi:anti-sigma B factor antagonist
VGELARSALNGCPAVARWRDDPTAPDLDISTRTIGDLVVVYVRGELDVCTNPRLCGRLAGLVNAGARDIVIDLADVSFLGVEAVRVLVDAHQWLAERGGRLTLSSPSRMARRVFELTGAADVLGTGITSSVQHPPCPRDPLPPVGSLGRRNWCHTAMPNREDHMTA